MTFQEAMSKAHEIKGVCYSLVMEGRADDIEARYIGFNFGDESVPDVFEITTNSSPRTLRNISFNRSFILHDEHGNTMHIPEWLVAANNSNAFDVLREEFRTKTLMARLAWYANKVNSLRKELHLLPIDVTHDTAGLKLILSAPYDHRIMESAS